MRRAAGSCIRPGSKPKLIFLQPRDYWHVVPDAPSGYWVDAFDIVIVRTAEDAVAELPRATCAVIGEPTAAIGGIEINNPQPVMDYLHYHRAYKTPYELELMREASRIGTRAHRAAEQAFRMGESELGIHQAYLAAAGQIDAELPYSSIVALNEHGAVLHYMDFTRQPPKPARSLLIDAGASALGYASDITRTYAGADAGEFQALIDAMDAAQQSQVGDGAQRPQLRRAAPARAPASWPACSSEHGFIRMSAEVGRGKRRDPRVLPAWPGSFDRPAGARCRRLPGTIAATPIARPDGHPFLRMTRTLEPGMVVTIEPGLYFIDMLLAELRDKPLAKTSTGTRIEAFKPYGGIRIEDDVVCTDDAPENLTRDAFALL